MKYVLDASVGLKTVLPEFDSAQAQTLVAEFQQRIHELIAPDTYLVECAHALARAQRKGLIQPSDAQHQFTLISQTSAASAHPKFSAVSSGSDSASTGSTDRITNANHSSAATSRTPMSM